MTKPRRRSLEVTCLYKVRDAHRLSDRAWQTFNGAEDRTRMGEYLNDWQTAENNVARCRSMRNAASRVAIRRSRHELMLTAARLGVDSHALLDWAINSPQELANDQTVNYLDTLRANEKLTPADIETRSSRSLQIVNDSGPNAPPEHDRGSP
jgi:hypothetical protein